MKKGVLILSAMFLFLISFSSAFAISSEPIIQASFTTIPSVVVPGNDGYIQMTLKNSGGSSVNRIKISYASIEEPIKPSGVWVAEFGALGAGDSVTTAFKFSVPVTASPGLYIVNFNIDYCDSSCRRITPNTIITVQSPAILEFLSITPNYLTAGENSTLIFKLRNSGEDTINNIILTWQASTDLILPLGSTNRLFIPSIGGWQTIEIPISVVVSPTITPNIYSILVKAEYYDRSGIKQNFTFSTGLVVSAFTNFEVSVQELSSTSTTLAISNTGVGTAYSTIVSIPQQNNFRVVGSSSNVIGNLNAGDYTLVSFQLVPVRNDTKELIVEISYTDALGIRRTVQKGVFVNIGAQTTRFIPRSQGQTISNGILYITIGVVGIVLLILFFKMMKRR